MRVMQGQSFGFAGAQGRKFHPTSLVPTQTRLPRCSSALLSALYIPFACQPCLLLIRRSVMSFAFAFGSFGDFVAVLQLAAAISTSLKEACSASAEINAVVLDIESFSLAIESARATIQRADTGHLPRSLDLALSHSLRTCSAILSKLQSKLKRMHALPGTRNRKWAHIQRAAWMWIALGGKADVEALKRRLVSTLR